MYVADQAGTAEPRVVPESSGIGELGQSQMRTGYLVASVDGAKGVERGFVANGGLVERFPRMLDATERSERHAESIAESQRSS
jgi:hypothetical protein